MAVKKADKPAPVNPLDQEIPTPEDMLQKAAVHQPASEQTTAQRAAAVSIVQEQPVSTFVAQGINPYADDPAYQVIKTIYMPLPRPGESPNATISLNGVTWKIPRGRPVKVPLPVFEQFERILEAEAAEIRMHNAMAAGMDSEHYGLGYLMGQQPV